MGKSEHPIHTAEFVISSPALASCPPADRPEYAFIGRSNVGKSSLINMLTSSRNLAKTSQTPGKTRLINHFLVNEEWYLVDLPGYGYAKISRQERAKWKKMIYEYLSRRENLVCTFILVDARHEPQKPDLEFMAWMSTHQLPFVIVFTKSDKLTRTKLDAAITSYKKELLKDWEELPAAFITSATEGLGREEILAFIGENNKLYLDYLKSIGR